MKIGIRLAGATCALALVLAACGGSSSNKSTGTNASATQATGAKTANKGADACTFVNQSDASNLFGVPAQTAARTPMQIPYKESECHWKAADNANHNWALDVTVWNNPGVYAPAQFPGAQDVSGLGDKAFVAKSDTMAGTTVMITKGGKVYQIEYSIANVMATDKKSSSAQSDQLVAMLKANLSRV